MGKQMAAMQKAMSLCTGDPVRAQDAKKDTKKKSWDCQCGFTNFGFRTECKDCGGTKAEASPVEGGAHAPGVMEVDCGPAKADPPEKVAKDLRNILNNLKGMKDANAQGSLVAIDLQKKLQAAEDEIRQSKPAHVRLQTAMRQRDALAASSQASGEAVEKSRLYHEAKVATDAGVKAALAEAEDEISAIQAELGRPQMEAGANAAVQVCVGLLQQSGMSPEATAQFMEALRCAFGTAPVRAAAPGGPSPFVVKVEAAAAAAAPAVGSGTASLFGPGGKFPSLGATAFPVGHSQEAQAEAAKLAALKLETQRQEWEQSRAEAVVSLKQRLEIQRLKHGAAAGLWSAALEVAKKAQGAGGGIEETERAEKLALDVQSEQNLIDSMECQRQNLESEAFSKAIALKPARGSPF
jgi:hypothetical protein